MNLLRRQVTIRLFGGPEVVESGEVLRLSPFQLALLAVVYGEQSVSRDRVAGILWRGEVDGRKRQRLRQLIHTVRVRAGEGVLVAQGDELAPGAGVICDIVAFRESLESDHLWDAARQLSAGFASRTLSGLSGSYDDWRTAFDLALRSRLTTTANAKWEAASQSADWASARDAAEALHLLQPADPRFVARVIDARAKGGKIRAAEAAYSAFIDRASLDTETSQKVEDAIRRARAAEELERGTPSALQPRFVGRKDAISKLLPVVRKVAGGRSCFALVTGEAGIGKTRLLGELKRLSQLEGLRCLSAQPVEFEKTLSLNPILDALAPVDLDTHLSGLGEPWRTVVGTMLPPGRLASPLGDLPSIEERSLSRRLLDAVALLLRSLADEQPTVFFLDDLQWADATTIAAFHFFLKRWPNARFGVIAAIRSENLESDGPSNAFLDSASDLAPIALTLEELNSDEARDLVDSLGQGATPEPIVDRILALAGRHPLYLAELTREYLAGRFRVSQHPGPDLSVPVSLRQIVSARMTGLSTSAKRTADALAVASRPIRLRDMALLLDVEMDEVADAVEHLTRAKLADASRDMIWVSHDLFRGVLYGGLSATRRAVLHHGFARHLLEQDGPVAAAELAIHLDRAGERDLSARYAWLAGEKAQGQGAMAEAAHFFELASSNDPDATRSADAGARAATALHLARDIRRANPALELAARRLRSVGRSEDARRLEIRRVIGMTESGDTRVHDLVYRLDSILEDAREGSDWEAVALALDVKLQVLLLDEQLSAVQKLEAALSDVLGRGNHRSQSIANRVLALVHMLRDSDAALSAALEAVELAEPLDYDHRLRALNRLLIVLFYRGSLLAPENSQVVQEARALAEQSGDLLQRFSFESNLAVGHLDAGDLDTAELLFDQVGRLLGVADMTFPRVNLACNRGDLALAKGDYPEAEAAFLDASRHAGPATPRYTADAVNSGLGLCALERGALSEARRREEALNRPPVIWYYDPTVTMSFRATLLVRQGKRDEALATLEQATAGVRGRLVTAWLKLRLIQARLLIRSELPMGVSLAEEARDVADARGLAIRANQFRMLIENATGHP